MTDMGTSDQLPPPPQWTALPEEDQCLTVHPSGLAVCRRGRSHQTSWHSDPQLRLTWRSYPHEQTPADPRRHRR